MSKQNSSKEVTVATACASIGAGATVGVAAVVGAPVTMTLALIGGAVGCLGGAFLSSKSGKK